MKKHNLVKFNDKQVKLTVKQKTLYNFINEKLQKNEVITFEEAKKMWIKNSCRIVINEIPHEEFYDWNKNKSYTKPMVDYFIRLNTINYLTRGIGVLVMKGALKIIPQLNLEIKL